MRISTVFRRAARRELDDAALWYERHQAGLGVQFVDEVNHAIGLAAEHPQRYPIMRSNVRCVRVRRFPYSVFYQIKTDRIIVLAVFHARRDPAAWRERA